MSIEQALVVVYLVLCGGIGVLASKRVLSSRDEYWVAGRSIGPWVNALAIMAALASGGSVVGVMGLAYKRGMPFTLAMFAGAVIGFPLAAILVAKPLRNFGKFTLTDFLGFRYPSVILRIGVPLAIVVSFTVYIVAQMKAAGITAQVLLGLDYDVAVTLSALVFILYVSIGGMLAVTWTDVVQGTLMLLIVIGCVAHVLGKSGSPAELLASATAAEPAFGEVFNLPQASYLGAFLLWATAISIAPHIVMRVFSAKDAQAARFSLNVATIFYSVMILAAVLIVVPFGKLHFPDLSDPDMVFLRILQSEFSPLVRGVAVAAVMAAVMSTTDALLLACSSAIAHDVFGRYLERSGNQSQAKWIRIGTVWFIGLGAMGMAYSPPKLITEFYSAAIGMLSAGLFIPTVAGLWWKKANTVGGVSAFLVGTVSYLVVQLGSTWPSFSGILVALPLSAFAMYLGSFFGELNSTVSQELDRVHRVHAP